MQVSATLIAAQQAAREARARMQLPQAPQATPQANFASALQDLTETAAPKATAKPAAAAPSPMPQAQAPGRLGQHVNIVV